MCPNHVDMFKNGFFGTIKLKNAKKINKNWKNLQKKFLFFIGRKYKKGLLLFFNYKLEFDNYELSIVSAK